VIRAVHCVHFVHYVHFGAALEDEDEYEDDRAATTLLVIGAPGDDGVPGVRQG
jgi:hypothetical protein